MKSILSKAPISRILVPYAIGILIPSTSYVMATIILTTAIIVAICFRAYSHGSPLRSYSITPYRIIPIILISFSLGAFNSVRTAPTEADLSRINNKIIECTINDIQLTDRSMSIVAKNANLGKILLTTQGCNYNLFEGCKIAFRANLKQIKSTNNPHEFDYSKYLRNNGIIYTQHLHSSKIHATGTDNGFVYRIKRVKYDIEKAILATNASSEAKYFVIAIVLGNNKYVGSDVQTLFSHAGIAHILALSGLHIGVITILLWFLLFPLDHCNLKRLRLIITLALIAFYALFTGLSPSVVRSTIMVGFTFASFVFFRKNSTLNSLLVAALIILVASPNAIYSLSFQLSFITVFFIAAFGEHINRLAHTRYKLLNYLISSALISIICTMSTAAITAFYFNSMPILSFATNLLVVPLLPLLMIIALSFTFFSYAYGDSFILSNAIEHCYNYIYHIAQLISSLPGAYIDNIFITLPTTICITFALIALGALFKFRNKFAAYTIGIFASLAFAFQIYHHISVPKEGFVIFNSFNSTPILYYNNHNAALWCPDHKIDLSEFKQTHKGFLAFHQIEKIEMVSSNATFSDNARFFPPFASLGGNNIVALTQGKWKRIKVDKTIKVDLAIITKRFHADIKTLSKIYDAKLVIISGDVYDNTHKQLTEQLKESNIKFHSIPENGPYEWHQ